jgi:hypothetical protein
MRRAARRGLRCRLVPDGVRVAASAASNQVWLQQGDTIANPYSGSATDACGSFR